MGSIPTSPTTRDRRPVVGQRVAIAQTGVQVPPVSQILTSRTKGEGIHFMPYTVYKVTNLVTQDFYIGVHKTNDPNDAYLGSGKVIREQVAHYGAENFQKDILACFDKRRDAYRLEAELVEPLLGTPGCLNIHPGGHGGFGYLNRPGGAGSLGRQRAREVESYKAATARRQELLRIDPVFREKTHTQLDRARAVMLANGTHLRSIRLATGAWTGRNHSDVTKRASSIRTSGAGNPMFGRRWVYSPATLEVVLVTAEQAAQLLADGWLPGKHPRNGSSKKKLPVCACGASARSGVCRICRERAVYAETQAQVLQLHALGHDTLWLAEHFDTSRRTIYRMLGGSG